MILVCDVKLPVRARQYLFVPGMSALPVIAERQASCAVPLRRPVAVGAEEQS